MQVQQKPATWALSPEMAAQAARRAAAGCPGLLAAQAPRWACSARAAPLEMQTAWRLQVQRPCRLLLAAQPAQPEAAHSTQDQLYFSTRACRRTPLAQVLGQDPDAAMQ